jgi:ribokinase
MNTVPHIFVVGSFVAASTACVQRLPKPGESLLARSIALEAGGKGFNLAVGARRLGATVDGIVPVGSDTLSNLAVSALEQAQLPLTMLQRYGGATGAGMGFIDEEGENCLAVYPGANAALSAADVRARQGEIAAAAITTAQFEVGDEPIEAAFDIARGAGRCTVLNPSPFRMPPPSLLSATSVLVLNAVEAGCFSDAGSKPAGVSDATSSAQLEAFARSIQSFGTEVVVVTLGAQGAILFRRGHEGSRHPACPIRAVDTLGAGDAFACGSLRRHGGVAKRRTGSASHGPRTGGIHGCQSH